MRRGSSLIHPKNAIIKYTIGLITLLWSELTLNGVVRALRQETHIKITSDENDLKSASHILQVVKWTNYYNQELVHVRPIAVDSDNDVWIGGAELTRIGQSGSQAYSKIGNVAAIAVNNNDRWFATHDLVMKYAAVADYYTKDDRMKPFVQLLTML